MGKVSEAVSVNTSASVEGLKSFSLQTGVSLRPEILQ